MDFCDVLDPEELQSQSKWTPICHLILAGDWRFHIQKVPKWKPSISRTFFFFFYFPLNVSKWSFHYKLGKSFWNQTGSFITNMNGLKYKQPPVFPTGLYRVHGNKPPQAGSRAPGQEELTQMVKALRRRNSVVTQMKAGGQTVKHIRGALVVLRSQALLKGKPWSCP